MHRAAFNQNQIDPTCLLCKEEPETVDHFLIQCSALVKGRQPIIDCILKHAEGILQIPIETEVLVQLLLDSTGVIDDIKDAKNQSDVRNIEMLAKKTMFYPAYCMI